MAALQRIFLAASLAVSFTGSVIAEDHLRSDTIVAQVGDTQITLGHMIALARNLPQQQLQGEPADVFENVLERLIQQEAVAQRQSAISPLTELQLENERRSLLASQEVERIFNSITITDADLQDAYDSQYAQAIPLTEYNASHILVESEDEAASIVTELRGGADFAAMARANSTGPSGPGGGQLGWFGPGRMVPPFEAAVAELEIGEISGPVETQFGWHVILLNDMRVQGIPTLDETRGDLDSELRQQRFLDALQDAIDGAAVERPGLGAFDPAILFDTDLIGN